MAVSTDEILQFFLNLISPEGFHKLTDTQIYFKFWETYRRDAWEAIKEGRKLVHSYEGYTFDDAVKILFMLDEPVPDEFKKRSKAHGTLYLLKNKTIYRYDKIYLASYTSMKLDACSSSCDYSCFNSDHRETWVLTSDEARKREERSRQQVQDIIADHEEHKEERLAAWRAKQIEKEKEEKKRKEEERKAKSMENRLKRLKKEASPESKPSRSVSRGTIENAVPDEKPIKPVQSRRQNKLPSGSPLPKLMGTSAMAPLVSPQAFNHQGQPGPSHQTAPIQDWSNYVVPFNFPPVNLHQMPLLLQQNQLLGISQYTPEMIELLKNFSSGAQQNGQP